MERDKSKWSHKHDYPLVEVWNTKSVLARDIVPRLQAFKELDKHGYPEMAGDMKQWDKIIQKMIDAFELIRGSVCHTEEENKIIDEGLGLFSKYFLYLWD